MPVTKIRSADDNGLVPAGAYFARLADTLSAVNAREAASQEQAEERKLEARYRRERAAPPQRGVWQQLSM
jgi:hypothetical protein